MAKLTSVAKIKIEALRKKLKSKMKASSPSKNKYASSLASSGSSKKSIMEC